MHKLGLARGKIKAAGVNIAAPKSRSHFAGWIILALFLFISLAAQGQSPASSIVITDSIPTSLQIAGPGYFMVQDTVSGDVFATRFGDFSADINGYLVTQDGFRLQGLLSGSTNIGSLNVESGGSPADGYIMNFSIHSDGKIIANYEDGAPVCAGQILLQNFTGAPLQPFIDGNYLIPTNAVLLPNPVPPGTSGLGTLQIGQIEFPLGNLALSRAQSPAPGLTQGVLSETEIPTDLAIEGSGYFVVRDTNSSALYATRAGTCYVDADGYLVNYAGMRLQGYNTTGLTNGDLQIPADGTDVGDPAFEVGYDLSLNGALTAYLVDGTTFNAGQVLLVNCANPESLVKTNFALYPLSTNAEPWTGLTSPGTAGVGWVIPGCVEASQCDSSILNVRQKLNFFEQGSIFVNTNHTDVSINGEGFFTVRDPVNNVEYATRHGAFSLDGSWLVDTNGYRVQGFTDPSLTTLGDIQVDAQYAPTGTAPNATLQYFTIGEDGKIHAELSDGTQFVRAKVTIQNYKNLQALVPLPGLLYSNLAAAQPLYDASVLANFTITTIVAGSLEQPFVLMPLPVPITNSVHIVVEQFASDGCLESSSDLVHWTKLIPLLGSTTWEAEFYDTNNFTAAAKYYRVRQEW